MQPDVVELLRDLSKALTGLGARWYLFGAQAVIAHGVPRFSDDVDVTVELGVRSPERLVRSLRAVGFKLLIGKGIKRFVRETRVLPFTHLRSGVDLDVVLAGPGPEEGFLERAREMNLRGVRLPVVTPEDLIVLKVLAGRGKDLDDVEGLLLRKNKRVDRRMVRAALGELQRAIDRSDLVTEFDRIDALAERKRRSVSPVARRRRHKRA